MYGQPSTEVQKHVLEKRQPPSVLGKPDIHMQKTEARVISLTLPGNPLTTNQKPGTLSLPAENTSRYRHRQ